MKFTVHCRSKKTKQFLENLVQDLIKELKIGKSRKELIVSVSAKCEHSGLAVDLGNVLFLGLRNKMSPVELAVALCHEMVHVKQMSKGQLKQDATGFVWVGKRFKQNTPYLDRPWEVEAFARQELILRKILVNKEK